MIITTKTRGTKMGILLLIIGLFGIAVFKDTIGSMLWTAVGYVWVKIDNLIDVATRK
jgi:hypothetical protein